MFRRGIEVDDIDLTDLFDTLDIDCCEGLSLDSFRTGLLRISGSARAKDIIKLQDDVARVEIRLSGTQAVNSKLAASFKLQVNELDKHITTATSRCERLEGE